MLGLSISGYRLAGYVLVESGKSVDHDGMLLVHEQL